jgi:hypothetical protein
MSKTYNYSKRSIQSDISEFSFSADWYLANENRRPERRQSGLDQAAI